MPIPTSKETDDFTAAALRFYDDATALHERERWDGVVYLCGYIQECGLKSRLTNRLERLAAPGTLKGKDFGHPAGDMTSAELTLAACTADLTPAILRAALEVGRVIDSFHPDRRYWGDYWQEADADDALRQGRELLRGLVVCDLLDHGGALR